ncbi:MAG: hypothetical protein J0I10_20890 [Verrucomicrobia bacterium]|nr:hypothetical protein [Verrucomicrobiota bacterium]
MMRRLWKRLFIAMALVAALCLGLVVLCGVWLVFDGWSDWKRTQEELRKRGELLTVSQIVPPPISDEQNFFADPFWQPDEKGSVNLPGIEIAGAEAEQLRQRFPAFADLVKEGNRHKTIAALTRKNSLTPEQAEFVLAVIAPVTGSLDAVERLSSRPLAHYPLDYSKGLTMPLPPLTTVLRLSQIFAARAQAAAALGHAGESARDVLLILRLGRAMEAHPTMIFQMAAMACHDMACDLIEKVLPGWSDAQAAQVQAELGKINLRRTLIPALRMERAVMDATFDELQGASRSRTESILRAAYGEADESRRVSARGSFVLLVYRCGFLASDRAFLNRCVQRWIDLLEGSSETLNPQAFDEAERWMTAGTREAWGYRHLFSRLSVPVIAPTFPRLAYIQTRIFQARVACGVQRYALRQGELPSHLADLVPVELAETPRDLIGGGPMHYRRDGREYLLWSIGWNAVDDGGKDSLSERKAAKKPDWVWRGRLPDAVATP